MQAEARWQCGFCGEWNDTAVDPGGGMCQRYVEDCQVCCRPSLLAVIYDPESQQYSVSAELDA